MSDANAVIVVTSTEIDIFCYLAHWLFGDHMSSSIKNCSPTLRLGVLKL